MWLFRNNLPLAFSTFFFNLGCQDADPGGLSVCRVLDAITYLPGSLTDIPQHQQVRHFLRQLSTEYIVNYIKLFLNKFWARIQQLTLRHKFEHFYCNTLCFYIFMPYNIMLYRLCSETNKEFLKKEFNIHFHNKN